MHLFVGKCCTFLKKNLRIRHTTHYVTPKPHCTSLHGSCCDDFCNVHIVALIGSPIKLISEPRHNVTQMLV